MTGFKTKIIWAVILIDILLFFIWLFLSFQTWQKVSTETAAGDLSDSQPKIELPELEHFLSSSQPKINVIESSVINQENVNSLIDQILDLSQGSGVDAAIDRATANKDGLDLIISAKGNFRNSIQFLRLMEKLPYRLTIDRESLTNQAGTGSDLLKVKAENSSSLWRAEIKMKILSYHQ